MKTKQELLSIFLDALNLPSYATKAENYLDDRNLLARLIDNEDLGQFTLSFAIEDLFKHVGIDIVTHLDMLRKLATDYSINDVVSLVYQKQHKTIEDVRQFFLEELGLLEAYRNNPDILKYHVLDGVVAKFGKKKASITIATMKLCDFVGIDSSQKNLWSPISQNPTFEQIIKSVHGLQP